MARSGWRLAKVRLLVLTNKQTNKHFKHFKPFNLSRLFPLISPHIWPQKTGLTVLWKKFTHISLVGWIISALEPILGWWRNSELYYYMKFGQRSSCIFSNSGLGSFFFFTKNGLWYIIIKLGHGSFSIFTKHGHWFECIIDKLGHGSFFIYHSEPGHESSSIFTKPDERNSCTLRKPGHISSSNFRNHWSSPSLVNNHYLSSQSLTIYYAI